MYCTFAVGELLHFMHEQLTTHNRSTGNGGTDLDGECIYNYTVAEENSIIRQTLVSDE